MENRRIGFALCGSFCTHAKAMAALEAVKARFGDVTPILSERAAETDTRFGAAHDLIREAERICDKRAILTVAAAEPLGPQRALDALVIAPCTGNTMAKLAQGITDGVVTMAAKAHMRNGGPLVLAVATNDGLGASARNLGALLARRQVFFVPFGQDDPQEKPASLCAEFTLVCDALEAALAGRQLQPVLLGQR